MKNLTNCEPVEFLVQTNKIRKAIAQWLKDTEILEIRKNKPVLVEINPDMTDDEKTKIKLDNREAMRKQSYQNLSDMLDAALEKHPQQTLELIAMMCFIEPDHVNDYKAVTYLKEFAEIISDKDVLDFFSSLMQLESSNILNSRKA